MIIAFSIFLGAVVFGLLLGSIKRQSKDVYVNGRMVEIVPLHMFSVELTDWGRKLEGIYFTTLLEGILLRGIEPDGEFKPVFQSSRKEAIYELEKGRTHGETCR